MENVILGIETSCDETAVALVTDRGAVLAHEVLSQMEHASFGGVVPEIAARAHYNFLHVLVKRAMASAKLEFCDLAGIAVTTGPGLIGSLIVGVMFSKAISYVTAKPIITINHLEAHALVARMTNNIEFPFLVLLISGGHCQFVIAHDIGKYTKLGGTIDDSLGEAFDKVSRILGLGYPGGAMVERKALEGNGKRFFFPRAMSTRLGCDFSFSGLKTAVFNTLEKEKDIGEKTICDICASFQECVKDILVSRICNAVRETNKAGMGISKLVVTGGVASNNFIRSAISECASNLEMDPVFPERELCTDNGIMVGWAGVENFKKGYTSKSLNFAPRARWPLENMS